MKPVGQDIGTEPAARAGRGGSAAWLPAVVAALVCVQIVTEVAQISAPMPATVLSWVLRALVAAALVPAAAGMTRGRGAGLVVGLAALGCVLSVQVVTLAQPVRLALAGGDIAATDWLPGMLVSLAIVTTAGAAVVVAIAPAASRYDGSARQAGVPPAVAGTARTSRSAAAAVTLVITLVLAILGDAVYLLAVLGASFAPALAVEVPVPATNLVLAAAALVLAPWLSRGRGWARLLALAVAGAHVLAIGGLVTHGITGGAMSLALAEVDGLVRWIIRPLETIAAAATITLLARGLRRTSAP